MSKLLTGMAIGNMLVPGPDRSIPAWNEATRQNARANLAENSLMAVAGMMMAGQDELKLLNRQVRDLIHHGIARESVMLSLHESLSKADPANPLVSQDPRAKARELLDRVYAMEELPDEYLDLVDQIQAEGKVEAVKRLVQVKEMEDAIIKREAMKDPDFERIKTISDAEIEALTKKYMAEYNAGKIEAFPVLIAYERGRRIKEREEREDAAKKFSSQPKT